MAPGPHAQCLVLPTRLGGTQGEGLREPRVAQQRQRSRCLLPLRSHQVDAAGRSLVQRSLILWPTFCPQPIPRHSMPSLSPSAGGGFGSTSRCGPLACPTTSAGRPRSTTIRSMSRRRWTPARSEVPVHGGGAAHHAGGLRTRERDGPGHQPSRFGECETFDLRDGPAVGSPAESRT